MKKNYALITGASGGLGKAMAQTFAANGHNLVLIARSLDKLAEIKTDLEHKFGVSVMVLNADITLENAAENIFKQLENSEITVNILVNNAGLGKFGMFDTIEIKYDEEAINLNIMALVKFTKLALALMLRDNGGKILNIGSIGGFQPVPTLNIYAATKAFVLSFSNALHYEYKHKNISVSVLCPGPFHSNFMSVANMEKSNNFKGNLMTAGQIAQIGYRGLMKNKPVIIPGFMNKLFYILGGLVPDKLRMAMAAKMIEEQ